MQAELAEHLGYEKGDSAGRGSPNSRNGTSPKTLASEVGDFRLDGPRDRAGTFEPRLVPKGARRVGGLDEMIISLYAGGMTIRDIQHHLARAAGVRRGRPWNDHRITLEGIIWRFRTGSPWRDLPEFLGAWQSVAERHRRWCLDGTYQRILDRVQADLDDDRRDLIGLLSVDSTSIRAHQHAAGARPGRLTGG